MIQMMPLPRQLPRVVVWSIYTVTWLGLIVSIVVVVWLYNGERQPPKKQQYQNDTREDEQHLHSTTVINNNSSPTKNHRHQQQSQPRTRPGFVTLDEIVAYECNFHHIYQNTRWLEGSDTEIKYLDEFGRARLMNVEDPSGIDLSWDASSRHDSRVLFDREVPSRRVMRNCRGVEDCRLRVWGLR